ncbi:MAG: hypothetical protein KF690_01265 [Bacteroidetes bacterium]|nr:hypothetical protein [Bacteroidota bacterium]
MNSKMWVLGLAVLLCSCGQMAQEARALGEKRCSCEKELKQNPPAMGVQTGCQQEQQAQADAFLEKYRDKMREDETFRERFRKAEAEGYGMHCAQ